jgi:hypothetical protein
MRQIGEEISKLLQNGEFESCYFAAASEINNAILEEVTPTARRKIEKNVPSNLIHADRDEIMRHFAN